jgi:hypothetical protein
MTTRKCPVNEFMYFEVKINKRNNYNGIKDEPTVLGKFSTLEKAKEFSEKFAEEHQDYGSEIIYDCLRDSETDLLTFDTYITTKTFKFDDYKLLKKKGSKK